MAQSIVPEPPGFSERTKTEQIRYLAALWDRIANEPGELPVPESHLMLAEQRLAARPALDVIDRLSKRSG